MLDHWIHGQPRLLARDGELIPHEMGHALVSEADVTQAVRERALADSLAGIHAVFLERNGSLSVVRRSN